MNRFDQSMMNMSNSLIDLFYSQQQTQDDISRSLTTMQQLWLDHANHSHIQGIPIFDGT